MEKISNKATEKARGQNSRFPWCFGQSAFLKLHSGVYIHVNGYPLLGKSEGYRASIAIHAMDQSFSIHFGLEQTNQLFNYILKAMRPWIEEFVPTLLACRTSCLAELFTASSTLLKNLYIACRISWNVLWAVSKFSAWNLPIFFQCFLDATILFYIVKYISVYYFSTFRFPVKYKFVLFSWNRVYQSCLFSVR